MTDSAISLTYRCGLRGYHVYWTAVLQETLCTIHESDNSVDRHIIEKLPGSVLLESTVGHLPKEISRATVSSCSMEPWLDLESDSDLDEEESAS